MASLRDLGLSEYEARAYRSLLRTAPTTAKALSAASDVPMGRVYDVLNALEGNGLVRSQAASRPKTYVAVEPETALERLLDDRKRELQTRAEQYESTVDELVAELDGHRPVVEQFWTVAVGPEETVELLLERLAAADDDILLVGGTPSPQLDIGEVGTRVLDELEAALDRGVSVSLLLRREMVGDFPAALQRRYTERLADHPSFAARTGTDVSGTFNLIDSVEVCIEVANPLDAGQALATLDFKDPSFAAAVRRTFERRWADADPLTL